MRGRLLFMASAWPVERFPAWFVRALVAAGTEVTLDGNGSSNDRVLGDLDLPRVRGLLPLLVAGQRRPGLLRRVLGALRPFWRRWDTLCLPAEAATGPYGPLLELRPCVLLVDRVTHGRSVGGEDRDGQRRIALRRAAAVLCPSQPVADHLVADGTSTEQVHVVPPAVDTTFFRAAARERPAGPLQAVCTAPLHWTTGHDYVLVALRQLLGQGFELHLTVAGDGPARARVLYTVQDLGLVRSVTVRGRTGRHELRELLQKSDVFVLPAVEDHWWPEVAEAMACGLPVVASDLPALRQLVAPSGAGYLVPARDHAGLARALIRVTADRAAARRMGQSARDHALTHLGLGSSSPAVRACLHSRTPATR